MSVDPTRRIVLLAGAATAAARPAAAEQAAMRRILAVPWSGDRSWPNWVAFEEELHRLGYVDSRNLAIDYIRRAFEMSPPALTEAIGVQIGHGAEVIIVSGSEHTLAAAVAATRTVPIVMIAVD
jgi:hypothetical protein